MVPTSIKEVPNHMAQPFVHLELNTPDLTKAKDFYGKLVGWTFEDMDMGPSLMVLL